MVGILFVCQGNLCRSPAAEAILIHLAHVQGYHLVVSSCGVAVGEEGHDPDSRMSNAVQRRGFKMHSKTKGFRYEDFDRYDLIFASDKTTRHILLQIAPSLTASGKVLLITEYSSKYHGLDIPDPYLGGLEYFDCVVDMLMDACEGILNQYSRKQNLKRT